jgi:hypothetical protein
VFLVAAGTEQVVQQWFDVLPVRGADLPDHPVTVTTVGSFYPRALRTASATWSMWSARRVLPAA